MCQGKYSFQKSEQITTGYFKIYKDTYKYDQKEDRIFHVLETADVALVLALDKDKQVILVKQFRAGPKIETLELPAGKVDEGEEPLNSAKRELLEETGYTGELEYVGSYYKSPSNTGKYHVYFCNKAKKIQDQQLTEYEQGLEVVLIPLHEYLEMINDTQNHQVTAAVFMILYRKRLDVCPTATVEK
ncbi:MAG: NUDIX hydrolase [Patescibacteria group bacterium]